MNFVKKTVKSLLFLFTSSFALLLWYAVTQYVQPVFWDSVSSIKTIALYLAPVSTTLVAYNLFVQTSRPRLLFTLVLCTTNFAVALVLNPYAKAQSTCMSAADIVREAEVGVNNRCMMLYNRDVHSHRSATSRPFDAWPKEHQQHPCQIRETQTSGIVYDATRLLNSADFSFHAIDGFVGANSYTFVAPLCTSVQVMNAGMTDPDIVHIIDRLPSPTPTPSPAYTIGQLQLAITNYETVFDSMYPPTQNSKVNLLDIGYVRFWVH